MTTPIPPLPPAPPSDAPAVLVFDPDQPWAEAVCVALREKGLVPSRAATPEEASWRLHERRFGLLVVSSAVGNIALESLLAALRQTGAPPPVLLVEDHRGGGSSEAWRFLRAARTLRRPCRVRDVVDAAMNLAGKNGAGRNAMA